MSGAIAPATTEACESGLAMPRVVISNGVNRFHLAIAAAEVARAGRLVLLFTGGYPTRRVVSLLAIFGFDRRRRLARLVDRAEDIPENLVQPLWTAELLVQLGAIAQRRGANRLAELFKDVAFRAFARGATKRLNRARLDAQILHYRSGFGLSSVARAKRLGLVALCDHSAVHPSSLSDLVGSPGALTRPWKTVLRDLEYADHVLVNSDFVKKTFLAHGWDSARVDVIYLGVDDSFLSAVPESRPQPNPDGPLRLLFAGAFHRYKGADILVDALTSLRDVRWQLEIAGAIAPESRQIHRRFLTDQRVTELGTLSRWRLAEAMSRNEIFVFPSLAEGSARVVFEALASGLYVVTTPNAGSIVQDGVHGALVPPHSHHALADALRSAAADRPALRTIGERSAVLVRTRYRQRDYGQALLDLYTRLGKGAS